MEVVFVYSSNVHSVSWLYMVWSTEFNVVVSDTIHDRNTNEIATLGCLIFFMSIGEGVPVGCILAQKKHICNIGVLPQ